MRRNVLKLSALVAVAVAACSEPTGIRQGGLSPDEGPSFVVTSDQGTITKTAGDNEIWAIGAFSYQDPAVRVAHLDGTAVANEPVTFTTNTLTGVTRSRVGSGTGCSATFGSTSVTVNTNASGVASTRWCSVAGGGQSMTAQAGTGGVAVTFEGIATTGGVAPTIAKIYGDAPLPGDVNNGTMGGQIVPQSPTVNVTDGTINLPSVFVNWTPSGDGRVDGQPGGALVQKRTDAGGNSAVTWRLRTTAGTNTLIAAVPGFTSVGAPVTSQTFAATAKPVGTSAVCWAGCTDGATTATNSRFTPRDPAARFTTATGASVGAGVRVVVTYGAGTNACGQSTTQPYFTDASGVVAVIWCNAGGAGSTTGTKTISFAAGDISVTVSGTVSHDFTTNNGTLTIDSGTGFTCTAGQLATPDLAVTFADAQGVKVVGGSVTFQAPSGGSVQNGTQSGNSITVTTNSAGQASARYTCAGTAGSQTVTATSSTNAQALIVGTATAGAAASITKIGGDNQTATAGTQVPKNPTVIVRDSFGNPVNGVNTNWVPSVNGTVAQANVTTGNAGQGSNPGVAANFWTLSTTAGANTLTVTAVGVAGSVVFNATGN